MTTETGGLDLDPDACSKHPDECCNCPPEGEYADEVESLASLCGRAGTPCASGLARIIQKQQTRVDALLAEVERLRQERDKIMAGCRKEHRVRVEREFGYLAQRQAVLDLCDEADRNAMPMPSDARDMPAVTTPSLRAALGAST